MFGVRSAVSDLMSHRTVIIRPTSQYIPGWSLTHMCVEFKNKFEFIRPFCNVSRVNNNKLYM